MARFFKVRSDIAKTLVNSNLTAAEWRIWCYLSDLDPFGDQYIDLPDTLQILEKCNISKATFYRAIAKLQSLEIFDFQDKGFMFRNLANSEISQKRDDFLKNETGFLKNETGFLKNETTSIYTDLQTNQTLSEAREKIERSFNAEPTEPLTPITEIEIQSPVNPVIGSEEKFSARCTTQPVQERSFNWLPQGPWNLEGKLDPIFRDWLAGKWITEYGKDIHTQRANVLSHFKKDPANLPIRWEQYQGEYLDRIQNTQILLNNGSEIPKEYQDRLIANQRAITAELPPALNPVAVLPESKPAAAIALPASNETLSKISALPQSSDYVKNEDGHKLKVFRASDSEVTPEEAAKNRQWLFQALKGAFGGKKAEIKPQLSELEELNNWIADPVLRSEAMKRIMNSDRYQCLFDEEGIPYQVIEIQPQSKPQTKLPDDYEYDF